MLIKKILFLISICVFITSCASTQTNQYIGNTEYAQSEQNEGPTKMGVRYLLGRGVPQNDSKAFNYFMSAANDDDPFAQNELAYMYAAGKGTSQDYRKALMYYQKAADHDLSSAQYSLGVMYVNGLGTAPNKAIARQWFQKSAAHGFEPAKQALSHYSS